MTRLPWLALSLLLLAPTTQAAPDAQGDVTLQPLGHPYDAPQLDLLDFSAYERDAGTIAFSYTIDEEPASENDVSFRPRLDISFHLHDQDFLITEVPGTCPSYGLLVGGIDGALMACVSPITEHGSDVNHTFLIPRSQLAKALDDPIGTGSTITAIQVRSYGYPAVHSSLASDATSTVVAEDHAPEDPIQLELSKGSRSSGHELISTTPAPIRDTNGDEATYVYPIHVTGEPGTLLSITAQTVEPLTAVHAPAVQIPESGTITVPVALSTPFAHTHGDTKTVTIHFADVDSNAWTETDIGLHWLTTPQPTGHHPQLWLHSTYDGSTDVEATLNDFQEGGGIWMNTLQDDDFEDAVDGPVPAFLGGTASNSDGATVRHAWRVPLDPGLLTSLQFMATGSVTGELVVNAPQPLTGATLNVTLEHCKMILIGASDCKGGWNPLASTDIEDLAWGLGETKTLELDAPLVGDDLVPYEWGSNIRLRLELSAAPAASGPGLSPELIVDESWIQLPLEEYREELPDDLIADAPVIITTEGDVYANPGDTIAIELHVTSDEPETTRIQAAGTHTEWLNQDSLQTESPGVITAYATIPANIETGTSTDFIWIADAESSPGLVSFARTTIHIVPTSEIDVPVANIPGESEDAPSAPSSFIIAILGAVTLALRRIAQGKP